MTPTKSYSGTSFFFSNSPISEIRENSSNSPNSFSLPINVKTIFSIFGDKENQITPTPILNSPTKRRLSPIERDFFEETSFNLSEIPSPDFSFSLTSSTNFFRSLSPLRSSSTGNHFPTPFSTKKTKSFFSDFANLSKNIAENSHITLTGIETPFSLTRISNGCHSIAFKFKEGQPSFYPNQSNDQLVIKVFHEDNFNENRGLVEKEQLKFILQQYAQLASDFSECSPEIKPYATIYNAESVKNDGYLVQEKINTFEHPLWNKETAPADVDMNILRQITHLFVYSYSNREVPGLDLKWENIGLRSGSGTLVVFDYFELDDNFYLIYEICLKEISNGNLFVSNYINEAIQPLIIR